MEKIRAVNLGGWFVLERWMSPALFDASPVPIPKQCETSFVTHHPDAATALAEHWRTWITTDDIRWLRAQGINLVRIPIPWWLFPDRFPAEYPYHSPLAFLDAALDFIAAEGMRVMLDLHTAPGSQNGFDNGGIDGVLSWHLDPKNVDVTVAVLGEIAKRYRDHPALHSIQVLNEPHWTIPLQFLGEFYDRAYAVLRTILRPETMIVFHDGFRFDPWEDFFAARRWKNVALDTHLYQCFNPRFHTMKAEEFLHFPETLLPDLERIERTIPVIVGEWSLGAHRIAFDGTREEFERRFARSQMDAYGRLSGWVFWSYRIAERDSGWNFRSLVERGILEP
ncbi:MAG: cellulase family glycosylhydrolase [Candidatus Izemoplasmatales bacterium]